VALPEVEKRSGAKFREAGKELGGNLLVGGEMIIVR
jgi:hypothetical protein